LHQISRKCICFILFLIISITVKSSELFTFIGKDASITPEYYILFFTDSKSDTIKVLSPITIGKHDSLFMKLLVGNKYELKFSGKTKQINSKWLKFQTDNFKLYAGDKVILMEDEFFLLISNIKRDYFIINKCQ
jgi:hypothetical protein